VSSVVSKYRKTIKGASSQVERERLEVALCSERRMIDVYGASAHIGIPVSTLNKMRCYDRDCPPWYKIRSRVYYDVGELYVWLAKHRKIKPSKRAA
jgi:hypothetical protein